MKKLLVAVASVLVAAATYGQGQVNFNNFSQNNAAGAPIWDVGQTGVKGPGATAKAGLWVISGGSIAAPTLVATSTFFDAAGADFLIVPPNGDGTVTLAGVPENTTGVQFEVRAWDSSYNTYEEAVNANAKIGSSGIFTGNVGALNLPANNLDNLQGFTLTIVPEPSTIALGLIGAGALLLRRRK